MPPLSERSALYFLSPQQRKVKHMKIVSYQPELRPALPCVFSAKDYREFRAGLIEMDRILVETGIEGRLISAQLASPAATPATAGSMPPPTPATSKNLASSMRSARVPYLCSKKGSKTKPSACCKNDVAEPKPASGSSRTPISESPFEAKASPTVKPGSNGAS